MVLNDGQLRYKNMKKNKKNYIISFIASLLIMICLIVLVKSNIFILNTFCLWLLGFFYIFGISSYFFRQISKFNIKNGSYIKRIIIGIIFCVILILILPINYFDILKKNQTEKLFFRNYTFEIEAIGEKNIESSGYIVCLEGIVIDGMDYNLYEIPLNESWKFIDSRPYSDSLTKSKIVVSKKQGSNIKIMFRKQDNAGKVKISVGNMNYTYDLYNNDYIQREELDLTKLISIDRDKLIINQIIFNIIYFIILFIIIMDMLFINLYFTLKRQHFNKHNT